jgi:hypothetical protein
MAQSEKVETALIFGEKLLGLAIDTIGAASVPHLSLGARDPKIVSLAILRRTVSNFKGAMILVRDGLLIEARTLTRCCYENLIWVAALHERGSEFVGDMLKDDAASRKTLGEVTLRLSRRASADVEDEDAKLLRDLIRQSHSRFPDSKKLHVDKTAFGSSVELAYVTFGQLSLEAVHPSITALGRHLHSELEGDTRYLTIEVAPDAREKDLMRTIWWSCDALLGVAVAVNEIVGGTIMNEPLREVFDELSLRSKTDLEAQASAAAEP